MAPTKPITDLKSKPWLECPQRDGFTTQQPRTLVLGVIVAVESQNHESIQVPITNKMYVWWRWFWTVTTSAFATAVKVSRTIVGWNFGLNRSVMVLKVTVIRVPNTPVFLPIALLCIQTMNKTGLVVIGIVYIATCKRPCSFCQGRDAC